MRAASFTSAVIKCVCKTSGFAPLLLLRRRPDLHHPRQSCISSIAKPPYAISHWARSAHSEAGDYAKSKDAEAEEKSKESDNAPTRKKRKKKPAAASSNLREVVVEVQRSKVEQAEHRRHHVVDPPIVKRVRAFCAAQEYNIPELAKSFKEGGFTLDPHGTDLYPEVIHAIPPGKDQNATTGTEQGELFIFPSGTLVAWDVPDALLTDLIYRKMAFAAFQPLKDIEEEELEYIEDAGRDHSSIRADRIIIGTKPRTDRRPGEDSNAHGLAGGAGQQLHGAEGSKNGHDLDLALIKIAFSSGLSRSTKLAALETLLTDYFEATKIMPVVMSRGSNIPFNRDFVFRKTGQLLGIRAQLNLYSELTDSVPDLFWETRYELGLEKYFDQVGKALDTDVRIRTLNEKMDYAGDIASVLRQQLSERHSVRLEWIIIVLIAVEVIIAVSKELKEFWARKDESATKCVADR